MTININELRRLAQAATPGPDGVSLNWVKLLQDFQKEANPAAVSELLDRLEAAEADALEQARMNGMGASREAALMAKLEAAEKERDNANAAAAGIALQAETLQAERDALRAKIEAMEKQEPVAWCATDETGTVIEALGMNQSRRFDTALYLAPRRTDRAEAVAYLDLGAGGYTDIGTDLNDEQLASLPKGRHMLGIVGTYGVDGYVSSQPAPSIPEGWPTDEMTTAFAAVFNVRDQQATFAPAFRAALAAAPEAKP